MEIDEYTWIKTETFRSEYSLTRNGAPIAQVRFAGICKGSVRVSGEEIDFTIERRGIMAPTYIVRSASGAKIAVARPRFSGSYDVELQNGLAARFRIISAWHAQLGWVSNDGTPLIVYTPKSWLSNCRTIVIRDRERIADDSLLLVLIVLGGVLAVKTEDDTAGAIAAIVGSAVAVGA